MPPCGGIDASSWRCPSSRWYWRVSPLSSFVRTRRGVGGGRVHWSTGKRIMPRRRHRRHIRYFARLRPRLTNRRGKRRSYQWPMRRYLSIGGGVPDIVSCTKNDKRWRVIFLRAGFCIRCGIASVSMYVSCKSNFSHWREIRCAGRGGRDIVRQIHPNLCT